MSSPRPDVKARRAASSGVLAVASLVLGVVDDDVAKLVSGAVLMLAALIEWKRPPGRGPLHPPQESTLRWLRERRRRDRP